jgi:hypothetical protein
MLAVEPSLVPCPIEPVGSGSVHVSGSMGRGISHWIQAYVKERLARDARVA